MQIKLLLVFCFFCTFAPVHKASFTRVAGSEEAEFHISKKLNSTVPFWETGRQKDLAADTASSKQSNWYADAMKGIEESEYEIKYDDATKTYTSPNRKNNLRSFYTANKFTLLPRNDSADKWKLDLTLQGVYSGTQKLFSPVSNPSVTQAGKTIRFNHNNDFTIEYINNKEGVRQNFIIENVPASNLQAINIKLKTNKGWFVNKVDDKEIHFAKATKTGYDKKITYNGLKVWDAKNIELEASFAVNDNEISIEVNTKGAVYPITIDPISTTPVAIIEGNQADAWFGRYVASAGDVNADGYSDVIVTAQQYDNGEMDEGAAFVFHGSATGISTTPSALLESNQAGAQMGRYGASAGDVNGDGYSDVIVGAEQYTDGQSQEGAAFIYLGSASGINPAPANILQCNQVGARFGYSVATAGDVNGDGYSDVIVGVLFYNNGQSSEGAAFVYHGSATGVNNTPAVIVESNQNSARMGNSVAPAGDINGDGYSDVIVGVIGYSNGQTDEGAAFIYYGSGTGINSSPVILERNQANAGMGQAVAGAGDINADGYSDIIVGAYQYDNGQTDEGAAFIYQGTAGGINTTASAILENNQAQSWMGVAVASAGDINGDGFSDVIVGSSEYDNVEIGEGAAFVYVGSVTGINTITVAVLESNQVAALMGWSVASAGDVNGDGYSDVIVGAFRYDNGQTDEGAAFVYHGRPASLTVTPTVVSPAAQNQAGIGNAVAGIGDVNGDGFSDVIIGAVGYDGGNVDEGRAWVFYGHSTGLSAIPDVTLDDANQNGAGFGYSVAGAGDVNGDGYADVVVGAIFFTDGGNTNEGRAWVYYGSAAGLSATPNRILDNANQANSYYGASVTSAGDVNGDGYSDVAVGASAFDDVFSNEGRVYVYYGSATGLSATPDRVLDDANQGNAYFGGVAGIGDLNGDGYSDLLVGANGYNGRGACFVYHGSATGLPATYSRLINDAAQGGEGFGARVSATGDVNGDGFSDIIITSFFYNAENGRAYVYYGHPTGLSATPDRILENTGGNAGDRMGYGVGSAGDVNGDGYSDIIVGVPQYDNPPFSNDGRVFIYHGSPTGISLTPDLILRDATESNEFFGLAPAGAGDINGDGYSDIIIGADHGSWASPIGGRCYVYYGNGNSGAGLRNNLRLYNTDLITPISRFNITEPNLFGAGLFAKSPLGRTKGKLVWEVKKQGFPFSGNPITNSTAYIDKVPSFSDLGIAGVELKYNIVKPGRSNKVRVRVEYDKVTAITGQVYGPWRYPAGYTQSAHGLSSIPLPITLISFNGQFINEDDVQLKWITTNETNMQAFTVERSTDGLNFTVAGELAATGIGSNRTDYYFTDKQVKHNVLFYRLMLKEKSGDISYTKIITLSRSKIVKGFIAPNPVQQGADAILTLQSAVADNAIHINIYNLPGQLVLSMDRILQSGINKVLVATNKLSKGIYLLNISADDLKENYRLVVQ